MGIKQTGISLAVAGLSIMMLVGHSEANEDKKPPEQVQVLKEAEKVKKDAKTLNSSIKEEIEKLRLERQRYEAEQLKLQKEFLAQLKAAEESNKTVVGNEIIVPDTFEGFDVRTPSGLTGDQLNSLLEGTGLAGLGQYYVNAERENGVNALVMLSLSALESAWGESRFAVERNNLFGFQAYDSNVNAARHFKSKEEAIMVVSKHLADKYLTEGAVYFNGYTLEAMNVRYASDKGWASKIASIMHKLSARL